MTNKQTNNDKTSLNRWHLEFLQSPSILLPLQYQVLQPFSRQAPVHQPSQVLSLRQGSSVGTGETAGRGRAVVSHSPVHSSVSSPFPGSTWYHDCLSLTFPGKPQFCKESAEGAGVCIKKGQNRTVTYFVTKESFFPFNGTCYF